MILIGFLITNINLNDATCDVAIYVDPDVGAILHIILVISLMFQVLLQFLGYHVLFQ
jgi:hypothetical protein